MKPRHLLALIAAASLTSLPISAQTFIGSDNFNDNTLTLQGGNPQAAGQWRFSVLSTGAAFSETNQRLEFTNSTATGTNYSSLGWISPSTSITGVGGAGLASGAPYTSSWSAQVAITNSTIPVAGYTLAGMELYSGANPSGNNAYYGIYLSNSQEFGNSLMVEWGLWNTTTSDYTRTSTFVNIGDTSDVTVRAMFDGSTKILSFDYSLNGATFTSTSVGYDLDGSQAGLTAPLNDGLGLALVGFSNNGAGAITAGQMYYDNLSVSAIPEPSTYAALAGLGALGLAIWRRRQSKNAA
jgi:hypothetical protein